MFGWLLIASSGPWVLGSGELNIYVGAEAQRLDRLHIQGADGVGEEIIDVGEGLSTVGAKAVASLGLSRVSEVEVGVPYYQVRANRQDDALCVALGLNACGTTQGLGIMTGRLKFLLLDPLAGAPLSVSTSLEGRIGQHTADERARITNLGEGTNDVGLVASAGGSSSLASGYWYAYVEGGYRLRVPTNQSYTGANGEVVRSPSNETFGSFEAVAVPRNSVGVGVTGSTLYRPGGLDFNDLDLADRDRLAALRVANARLGGVLQVRATNNLALSVSAQHTVLAINNPFVTSVSVGISTQGKVTRKPSAATTVTSTEL